MLRINGLPFLDGGGAIRKDLLCRSPPRPSHLQLSGPRRKHRQRRRKSWYELHPEALEALPDLVPENPSQWGVALIEETLTAAKGHGPAA